MIWMNWSGNSRPTTIGQTNRAQQGGALNPDPVASRLTSLIRFRSLSVCCRSQDQVERPLTFASKNCRGFMTAIRYCEMALMKLLLILSFLGILFCLFVTVHPDAETELLLVFLTCCTVFLSSAVILIRRRIRQSHRSNQPGEQDDAGKPDPATS